MSRSFLAVIVLLLVALALSLALVQASPAETVQAARDGDRITLSNDAIAATWSATTASSSPDSLPFFVDIVQPLKIRSQLVATVSFHGRSRGSVTPAVMGTGRPYRESTRRC